MLEELTPEEFAFHIASYKLDPFGDDWHRSSMIAAVFHNTVQMMAAAFGGGELDDTTLLDLDAFVPFRERVDLKEKELEASLSLLEQERGLE